MIFWLFAALLTAGALAAVLRPLMADRVTNDLAAADYDIEVYKSQLAEVERDAARGQLAPAEAEAARTEIGRRLLDADRRRERAEARRTGTGGRGVMHRLAPYGIAIVLPGAAFGLYLQLGQPGAPDRPLALRDDVPRQTAGAEGRAGAGAADMAQGRSLDQAAAGLRQRLEAAPDDPDGWMLLARTEMTRGAYRAAAEAYGRARALVPEARKAELASAEAEALAMAAGGVVTERAQELFRQAKAADPDDLRAEYYLAEADLQAGRVERAMDRWIALAEAAPPGAPYLPAVNARARAAAEQLGRDIEDRLPQPAAPQPPPAQATGEGPVDLDALEARIAANPTDFEAWVGLVRGRAEAGETEAAKEALARARETFAEAPFPRRQLDQLAVALGLEAGADGTQPRGPSAEDMAAAQSMSEDERRQMVAGMVEGLAARLEENPDDLQGWMMLARSYQVLERPQDALAAYRRAGDLAPEDIDVKILEARLLRQMAGERPTEESVALMREVAALDPDNTEANWFLGLDALRAGDRETARTLLRRALSGLPEGSGQRDELAREVERLLAD